MAKKFRFYERDGVEAYYLYDPDKGDFSGWLRAGDYLEVIENLIGWISPRLTVRFELVDGELEIYRLDGEKFATSLELVEQNLELVEQNQQAKQQLEQERLRSEKLAAKLKELGIDPEEL